MTRADVIKLRAKLADLPKPPSVSLPPPIAKPGPPDGGPSTPSDIQEYQLKCQLALVDGQRQALELQHQLLALMIDTAYNVSLIAERFHADFYHPEPIP